ncbi:hypothetical protein WDZ92_13600 [Nostoc sp. NIES-2111]
MVVLVAAAPALAGSPLSLGKVAGLQSARMVCSEWDQCWDEPDYAYRRGYRYRDEGYLDPHYRRPPTKWERKGFCPPGQAKKGNC